MSMIRIRLSTARGVEECEIEGTVCVIGRSTDCAVAMPLVTDLSRHHLRFTLDGDVLSVEDLGSRHGTFVRGMRVGRALVRSGDEVRAGGLTITVLDFGGLESTLPMPRGMVRETEPGPSLVPRITALESDNPLRFEGFRLLRTLGSGGMGVVYAADNLVLSERVPVPAVALKVLRPELAQAPQALQEFVQEMMLLGSLDHPGIVRFFGHGHADGWHYLVMELVEGESVRERIRNHGPLPWSEAVRITERVVRTLRALWRSRRIVHGDLKPANMLVDAQGAVKLCDFGLSRRDERADDGGSADRRGTAAYSAPELFDGRHPRSPEADQYALGISLFQMVTGKLPFEQLGVAELRRAHEAQPLPSMTGTADAEGGATGAESVPEALSMIAERLCAKDPRARYRDHDELLADLSLLLQT